MASFCIGSFSFEKHYSEVPPKNWIMGRDIKYNKKEPKKMGKNAENI